MTRLERIADAIGKGIYFQDKESAEMLKMALLDFAAEIERKTIEGK